MTIFERVTMTVQLPLEIRFATHADLPKMEWYGQYTHFRNVFRRTYHEQQQGKRLMLLADSNDFPIGQIFIHLDRENHRTQDDKLRAYLYSLRVMEMFRGLGIGSRLINEAESITLDRGFHWVSIGVAKDNLRARRLYERLGYRIFREDAGYWSYIDHRGHTRHVYEPCWLLEKRLIS